MVQSPNTTGKRLRSVSHERRSEHEAYFPVLRLGEIQTTENGRRVGWTCGCYRHLHAEAIRVFMASSVDILASHQPDGANSGPVKAKTICKRAVDLREVGSSRDGSIAELSKIQVVWQ